MFYWMTRLTCDLEFLDLGQGRDTEPAQDTRQRHSGRPCSACCSEEWQEGQDVTMIIDAFR